MVDQLHMHTQKKVMKPLAISLGGEGGVSQEEMVRVM
jgi:hypothetical protein